MVVKLLLNILKKYNLCANGVNIQFVTHKKDNFHSDEFYTGSILVTPYDKDKKLNYHQGKYFDDVNFKLSDKREAFKDIVRYYNKKNCDKKMFIPLYIDMMNYCTIQ